MIAQNEINIVRPKIVNREKHQGKHGKYPKDTYGEMGETCRELPLGGFLSKLVTSFQAASYISGFSHE